jgi:hypothetical protein
MTMVLFFISGGSTGRLTDSVQLLDAPRSRFIRGPLDGAGPATTMRRRSERRREKREGLNRMGTGFK